MTRRPRPRSQPPPALTDPPAPRTGPEGLAGALAPVAGPEGAATLVRVHVSPGANRSELRGYDVWRRALGLSLAAPAREGKANVELCRLLAEALGVPQAAVAVVEGQRSRLKRVRVEGLSVEAVEGRLRKFQI